MVLSLAVRIMLAKFALVIFHHIMGVILGITFGDNMSIESVHGNSSEMIIHSGK